jgi:CRP-like cAMP-binding protein
VRRQLYRVGGEFIGVAENRIGEARHFPSSKLAVLRKHPIFRDLDSAAFDQLCRYAKHATLKRGATIFSKGDPGNSLVAVISGTVKISISSPDGRSAILNLIGPGEIFGEVAVLDGQARTADATANTNCEIFIIDRREFLPFVRSQPALAMKFIELLCKAALDQRPGRTGHSSGSAGEGRQRAHSPDRTAQARARRSHDCGHPAGAQRDGRHDAREHQQATARLGCAQLGSA